MTHHPSPAPNLTATTPGEGLPPSPQMPLCPEHPPRPLECEREAASEGVERSGTIYVKLDADTPAWVRTQASAYTGRRPKEVLVEIPLASPYRASCHYSFPAVAHR